MKPNLEDLTFKDIHNITLDSKILLELRKQKQKLEIEFHLKPNLILLALQNYYHQNFSNQPQELFPKYSKLLQYIY